LIAVSQFATTITGSPFFAWLVGNWRKIAITLFGLSSQVLQLEACTFAQPSGF
jgi:hypothetical protein